MGAQVPSGRSFSFKAKFHCAEYAVRRSEGDGKYNTFDIYFKNIRKICLKSKNNVAKSVFICYNF